MNYIKYIPLEMREIKEYQALGNAGDIEIDKQKESMSDIYNNRILSQLTPYGCSRYEKILGIEGGDSLPLEVRRKNIIAKVNNELPYTIWTLKRKVATILENDNFTLDVQYNSYLIRIILFLDNKDKVEVVREGIDGIIPCNMIISMEIKYNSHGDIQNKSYTHSGLSIFTHREIRESTDL